MTHHPVTRLRRTAALTLTVGLSGLMVAGMFLPSLWPSSTAVPTSETPRAAESSLLVVPDVITQAVVDRVPQVDIHTPSVPQPLPDTVPLLGIAPPQAAATPAPVVRDTPVVALPLPREPTVRQQPPAPAQPPPKKRWAMLIPPSGDAPQAVARQAHAPGDDMAHAEDTALAQAGRDLGMPVPKRRDRQPHIQGGTPLITQAQWAIPASPLKTVYRSQTLAGRLLQAVHSDLPGQVTIQLTVPVLDKFGYDTTIVPKDALVIAMQEGRTTYGQTRLGLTLQQLEFPTGEVVRFTATIGDPGGTSGVQGKVNNHYGKLILGTGLSALLNIGVRQAVGTPSAGQFFRDPIQEAAEDVGQSVQAAAQDILKRELQVAPTLTIPAGTFCTINLLENITFHAPPVVAP